MWVVLLFIALIVLFGGSAYVIHSDNFHLSIDMSRFDPRLHRQRKIERKTRKRELAAKKALQETNAIIEATAREHAKAIIAARRAHEARVNEWIRQFREITPYDPTDPLCRVICEDDRRIKRECRERIAREARETESLETYVKRNALNAYHVPNNMFGNSQNNHIIEDAAGRILKNYQEHNR